MRRLACLSIALVALSGSSAEGASPRLIVKPLSPVAGAQATIELHATAKAPVYVDVRAPTGARSRARLQRVRSTLWRGAFTFRKSGLWTLKTGRASTQVLVAAPLPPPAVPASAFSPPGAPGCAPPSPANDTTGEARGTATVGDLWSVGYIHNLAAPRALVLRDVVGKPTKILWRMVGSGEATFTGIAPDGSQHPPTDVLRHPWSTWNRPGDEWGSIWRFTSPGCWQIHAERTNNAGDLWLLINS